MEIFDVVIIGGGLGGIISAIELKKKNINVCIIEAKDRIGKKILASGNGKCNILNSNLSIKNYNNNFPSYLLTKYNYNYLSNLYKSYGIVLKEDSEGRVYPYSESANTILNVLLEHLKNLKVKIKVDEKVLDISKKDKYLIATQKNKYVANDVILASGANATFGFNSHALYAKFGHKTTKLKQALVPIRICKIKGLSGVRVKVKLSLYIDKELIFSEIGEILFKDNALSGIVAFKASTYIARYMVKNNKDDINAKIVLDFMPDLSQDDIDKYLKNKSLKNPLDGMLHKALAMVLNQNEIKHFDLNVDGLLGVENAQVISGGLCVEDFDNKTCESKLQDGLYAIGEVLDVDGECGGYNFTFAAASALCAANHIIKKYAN